MVSFSETDAFGSCIVIAIIIIITITTRFNFY